MRNDAERQCSNFERSEIVCSTLLAFLVAGCGKDKMQEVTQAIEKATKDYAPVMETMDGPPGELMEAAHKWSNASLQCFGGELLRKAMLLAAAMAEFAHEARNPS